MTDIAQKWSNATPWYNSPCVFGACLAVHGMALVSSTSLYLRVRSWFYLSLCTVVVCDALDLFCEWIDNDDVGLTPMRAAWYAISWLACCGFDLHNYHRYRALTKGKRRIVKWVLGLLTALTIALYTLCTVNCYRAALYPHSSVEGDWTDQYFVGNGMFVFELSVVTRGNKGVELRPGYVRLVQQIKLQLLFECSLILATTIMGLVNWQLDPLFLTPFFAQGVRLQVYCNFLNTLNRIMSKRTQLTGGGFSDKPVKRSASHDQPPSEQAHAKQQFPHPKSGNQCEMVVAQRWLDQSPWYRGSMVYGACITVYLIALSTAATIYLRVRTHLYLTLLLIVICSMLDVTFNAFDDNNMPGLTPLRSVWYIISWLGCVGFSVHNFARFCALVQTRHVVLKIALVLWILLSISLYTLATVNCYRQALDSYSSMMGNWNDQYFVGLAQRWGSQLPWYNGPFVLGACIAVHATAFVSSVSIFARIRTIYYFSLVVLVACSCIDLVCQSQEDNSYGLTTERGLWYFISWVACSGFDAHNFFRLCAILPPHYRALKAAMGMLATVTIFLYTLATIDLYVTVATYDTAPASPWQDPAFVGNAWLVVDTVYNTLASAIFIRELSLPTGTGEKLMIRPELRVLLVKMRVQLVFECALILTSAVLSMTSDTFDPLNITPFFAQGVRLQIYCNFLDTLTIVLNQSSVVLEDSEPKILGSRSVTSATIQSRRK
ncbi:hypothetical protein RI367_002559 [Sorochytrium milnesiophthora]